MITSLRSCKNNHLKNKLKLRPRLHEYVFIENDIVFNENATIVLRVQVVYVSLSDRFQPSFYTKTIKMIEYGKNQQKSIVCVLR